MLTAGIFLAVTAGALLLLQFGGAGGGRDRGLVRRRLAQEFAAAGSGPAANALFKDLGSLNLDSWGDKQPTAAAAPARPTAPPPPTLWQRVEAATQSGLPVTARQLVGLAAVSALLLGVAGGYMLRRSGAAGGAAAGAAGGAVIPFAVANAARKKRRERLIVQLSNGFDQMSRVLRAGQSVSEALRAVVETSGEPLAGEFSGCLHEIELGIRPEEAFARLGKGSSVLELRLFVVAMNIQRQTGGNLAEVLDRLATLTRNRVRLRQKINALTAEGRLQSVTLVVLPPLTFAVMYLLNRQYAQQLLDRGQLLAATAGLMLVGVLWTRKIINFEGERMTPTMIAAGVFVFLAVAAGVAVGGRLLSDQLSSDRRRVLSRLKSLNDTGPAPALTPADDRGSWHRVVAWLGAKTARGKSAHEKLRADLEYAGYTSPSAPAYYHGTRVALTIGLAVVGAAVAGLALRGKLPSVGLWGVSAGLLGYILPSMHLGNRVKARQQLVRAALPDALDVMVMCVESGASVAAAVDCVADEFQTVHPVLGEQLVLVRNEMQFGATAGRAFQSLADRSGVAEIRDLAAILSQSEQYGTSVGKALRTHSEAARTERQLWCEGMAAKAAVKIMFPTLLCIFPAMFIVLLGPAAFQMSKMFSK